MARLFLWYQADEAAQAVYNRDPSDPQRIRPDTERLWNLANAAEKRREEHHESIDVAMLKVLELDGLREENREARKERDAYAAGLGKMYSNRKRSNSGVRSDKMLPKKERHHAPTIVTDEDKQRRFILHRQTGQK